MYDVDHDGYLTRAEMLHMTRMTYKAEDYPLEEADRFVDEAFSKMDQVHFLFSLIFIAVPLD
jgi:Ca2+-binding EF-hand superfamily protein